MKNKKRFRFNLILVTFTVLVAGLVCFSFSETKVWASGITVNTFRVGNSTIPSGGSTTLEWNVSGATRCTITNSSNTKSYSGTIGNETITLTQTTTYYLTCTDDMVYYQLYSCYNDNNLLEIGPVLTGTYSTGDIVTGTELGGGGDGDYDYRVTGTTENDTSRTNISVTKRTTPSPSCNPESVVTTTTGTITAMSLTCSIPSGSSSCS